MMTRATGLIAALALLWGSGFFWIKLSLDGFTPTQLTFLRLAFGALVLVPIVIVRKLPRPRGAVMWGHLAISALIASAIPYALFAIAEQTVSSSLAGVINATAPLWTVLIARASRADTQLTGRRALGVLIGFLGALVVLEPWSGTARGALWGVLACAGAALSYGLAYVYQARYLTNRSLSPLTLTAAQLVLATGFLAIAVPAFGGVQAEPSTLALGAVFILGTVGTGLALIINFTLIAIEGPTGASVVTYLIPIVALVLGILVLHEPARWTLPFGALLVLAGVTLVQRGHAPAAQRSTDPAGAASSSRPGMPG